ncbi:hypothetical protein AQF52_7913 [Streptomyces venezuelae]|nr:hypothetical protein AQF52_7913 [Streptomyces venezuelae]CUM35758.1 hypothetical protein BN2537_481 [Streptomyces venezuelae]
MSVLVHSLGLGLASERDLEFAAVSPASGPDEEVPQLVACAGPVGELPVDMMLSGSLKYEAAAGEVLQKGNGGIHAGARAHVVRPEVLGVCVARRRARGITDQRTYGRRRLAWWG